MVKRTIEDVLTVCRSYLNENNVTTIYNAYLLAKEKHEGQFRKSGDPYIQHPIEVAYMLAELHTAPATVCAGFLHDILEDTELTKEELTERFGSDVVSIVDGVTKISQLKYMTKEKALAKTHQKILLAMAKDIRVVLVKLIDRVHNMRTLEFQPVEKQVRISRETLDLYAPLAHRMGMYRIKAELEDISFKYLEPQKYQELYQLINSERSSREDDIELMKAQLVDLLAENNISGYELKGRIKNIYSVNKKMVNKNLQFSQIYDLMAMRILVPSIEDCYHVLGCVHSKWAPLPKRFKDYIATPKPNLYQSLHTTVVGYNGKIYEIQIRTYEMDKIAELGVAAHWAYKEDAKGTTPEKTQLEVAAKLKWYSELLTYAELGEQEDSDPLHTIKEDIFSANVYVFTPNGDVMDFPTGATPLDFAYRVHTQVGNHAVGAIANGKIVPLTYHLKTGDVIEIKTNKNFDGPKEEWVKIVKTSHARHKIIGVLNKKKREQFIADGKDAFEKVLKAENCTLKFDDKQISETFTKLSINNFDDLYFSIGKGEISPKAAYNKLAGINEKLDEESLIKQYNDNETKVRNYHRTNNAYGIFVEGLDKAQIKLANCCHPVKGDDVVGYISKGNGIIVHRLECSNVTNSDQNRFINVFWDSEYDGKSFESSIHVISYDKRNIVADMINVLNSTTVSIASISSQKNRAGDLLTKIKIYVKNLDMLENAMANIKNIPDVYSVERVRK